MNIIVNIFFVISKQYSNLNHFFKISYVHEARWHFEVSELLFFKIRSGTLGVEHGPVGSFYFV